ncbi:glycosyltransferase 87 family protein [Streptacidiphilus monticola]
MPDRASAPGALSALPVGRLLTPWGWWLATRTVLLLMVLGVLHVGLDVTSDVKVIYQGWAAVLRTGTFPLDDVTWQYPPLAALVIIAPSWLPWSYFASFLALLGICDAAAMGLLTRAARRGGATAGLWLWAAAVPLLGPTVYTRFDLAVTVLAMAALVFLSRRPRVAGVLIGLGTMIKVWPVVLLIAARRLRVLAGAAVSALVVAFGFAVFTVGAYSFMGFQGSRGIEVESVPAVPCYFASLLFGWPGRTQMHYGSLEFLGPGVPVLAALMPLLTLAGLGWLLWWRRRAAAASSPRTPG